jgi:flagellar basal-body rod modification protein FlgD
MIEPIVSTTNASTSSIQKTDALGKDVFLNLLITQLKHQDPLEPMEGTEFVTQLAQFSELDELRELTGGQEDLQGYMASLNNFAAVSLLGKDVEFSGDRLVHQEGASTEIQFRLPAEAAQVSVLLYDTQGRLVHTLSQGTTGAGNQSLLWSGTDENGEPLPSGTYRFDVVALDAKKGTLPVQRIQRGAVQEVTFESGAPLVRVDQQWIPMAEIRGIRMPGSG